MTAEAPAEPRFAAYARVALPLPLNKTFSYGVPEALSGISAGCRVRVRFGARSLVGCVVAVENEAAGVPPEVQIRPITTLLDSEPVLPPSLLALATWMADYYLAAPGEVLQAILPPETPRALPVRYLRTQAAKDLPLDEGELRGRLLHLLERPLSSRALSRAVGKKRLAAVLGALVREGLVERVEASPTGARARQIWTALISEDGRTALAEGKLEPTTARVLTLLATATEAVPVSTIRSELKVTSTRLQGLARKGLLFLEKHAVLEDPWERLPTAHLPPPDLTEAQAQALRPVEEALSERRFFPLVLHGVTGSGKTEIYLRAAERALALGRSVLFLVPEIALTTRLAGLLRGRFHEAVAILHSGLGSGERRDEWWRVRRGRARVVLGARRAVLAPLERIGLIVVDEEHDVSYKQEESPRYHARDVAVWRAREEGAVAVLGSATPSIESFQRAREGPYRLASLPDRIGKRALAEVRLIDMKEVIREEGPDTILSAGLRAALAARIEAGQQAIVLLNRRGYSTQLACRECGLAATCSECSVSLTLHRKATLAVCHYCGLGRPTPARCDLCSGEYLRQRGYGTERVEEILSQLYPGIRVARMDRDTMRRRGSYEALFGKLASGAYDVLVGTQMVAKGHDFPSVTLVGVLAADAGLGVPDFRAAERTFQILTQVAGRAGRGEQPGEVLIQTFAPDHYAIVRACAQDYLGFFQDEMGFRRSLRYPPALQLINLVFEAPTMARATLCARRVAAELKRRLAGVELLGPAFAPRSRVAGRYRAQLLIKTPRDQHRLVRSALRELSADPELSRAMALDVDPMSLV
jgi:primosomal protein N' (replication factor Y)